MNKIYLMSSAMHGERESRLGILTSLEERDGLESSEGSSATGFLSVAFSRLCTPKSARVMGPKKMARRLR